MINYYVLIMVVIVVICIGVLLIRKLIIKANSSTDLSSNMIAAGLSLIVAAFPGTKDTILFLLGSILQVKVSVGTDYVAIVCGFALLILGMFYRKNIMDRVFVLNMLGLFAQHEISDDQNIEDLKLADFKVKEVIVDFVDVFNIKMTDAVNDIIVRKIEKVCNAFVNRSKDFKSCFTGMAPIPYTILAGTYLSSGNVRRYFEYKRSEFKFYELSRRKKNKKYDKLHVSYPLEIRENTTDVVVALSITRKIQQCDMEQFTGMDIIEINLSKPKDNVITSINQLDDYAFYVLNQIEQLKERYKRLKTVHFVASIPSCVSIEIGKLIIHNSNRLPKIISYHYVNNQTPKYPFGVVITDNSSSERGELVKGGK